MGYRNGFVTSYINDIVQTKAGLFGRVVTIHGDHLTLLYWDGESETLPTNTLWLCPLRKRISRPRRQKAINQYT
jgi:hypothetical protein